MFCKNCGSELGQGVLFCPKCGTKAEVSTNSESIQKHSAVVNVAPTLQQAAGSVNPKDRYNKVGASALSAAGNIKKTSPYIIPVIIPCVLILVEMIALVIMIHKYNTNPELRYRNPKSLAKYYYSVQEYDKAVELYEELLEDDPDNEELQYGLLKAKIGQVDPDGEDVVHMIDGYVVFGNYEQCWDAEGLEPIQWIILDENENGVLLMSRYVLVGYNLCTEAPETSTWEDSDLREYLNGDFYERAFSDDEKDLIVPTVIPNLDNSYYGTPGGESTRDNVFCLSIDEVVKYYGFENRYVNDSLFYNQDLIAQRTTNANVPQHSISRSDFNNKYFNYGYKEDCVGVEGVRWCLRTSGQDNHYYCYVDTDGCFGETQDYEKFSSNMLGIRPVLYIESLD